MKSVVDYFREVYGFTIQHPHLPCLQVGNQKKVNYMPMEVKMSILPFFCKWLFYPLSVNDQFLISPISSVYTKSVAFFFFFWIEWIETKWPFYPSLQACKIVEGQRRTKGLNNKQITSLLKFSCQRPKEQEKEILQVWWRSSLLMSDNNLFGRKPCSLNFVFFQTMHQSCFKEDPYLKEFGITIDDKLTSVDARVLPAPWVCLFL